MLQSRGSPNATPAFARKPSSRQSVADVGISARQHPLVIGEMEQEQWHKHVLKVLSEALQQQQVAAPQETAIGETHAATEPMTNQNAAACSALALWLHGLMVSMGLREHNLR